MFHDLTDYDGTPGDEIAMVAGYDVLFYGDRGSGPYLRHRFSLPSYQATFLPAVDTNGVPGAEIVVARRTRYLVVRSFSSAAHTAGGAEAPRYEERRTAGGAEAPRYEGLAPRVNAKG